MFNSLITNNWAWLAATYQFLIYIGFKAEADLFFNEQYMNACTCNRDAEGIKKLGGTDDRSNEIFSSCSEGAVRSRIIAENGKDAEAQKREDTYIENMKIEAKETTIEDTFNKLKTIPGCDQAVPDDDCYTIVKLLAGKAKQVLDYRNNMLVHTGGKDGTNNE